MRISDIAGSSDCMVEELVGRMLFVYHCRQILLLDRKMDQQNCGSHLDIVGRFKYNLNILVDRLFQSIILFAPPLQKQRNKTMASPPRVASCEWGVAKAGQLFL
jgi:hypothetical protein